MIRLRISAETESFRERLRSWLSSNPAPVLSEDASLEQFIKVSRTWQAKLASGGWIGISWPKEFGGQGLSLVEEAIFQEELVASNSPQLVGLFGLTMVGPVLIKHGTTEQKQRYLNKIIDASEIWCQGFSEPGAGSDLSAVKTRAERVPGGYSITGQKVWTSFAQVADWGFVLCRTSTGEKKHQGLTYLLVNMKSAGITLRPLRQISGDDEFNEVFFDSVFVPDEQRVGAEGEGWAIAISTLMYERVVLTFSRQLQSELLLRKLLKSNSDSVSTEHRSRLSFEISRAAAVRALAYQHLIEYSHGKTPGPEGSLDKLLWSESFQSICKLALELAGPDVSAQKTVEARKVLHDYLYSRGRTIAAGTSEIQRNIIAQRLLGLGK